MNKKIIKSVFVIACVVAASVSGFKAYDQHNKNVAAANMLLTENVEALSAGDNWIGNWIESLFNSDEEHIHYCLVANPCYVTTVVNGRTIRVAGVYYTCEMCIDPNSTCDFSVTGQCRF